MSSMGGISLEKGKWFCTSSRSDRPVDQTSARMEYSRPERRSGCKAGACQMQILRDKMNPFCKPPCDLLTNSGTTFLDTLAYGFQTLPRAYFHHHLDFAG